MEKNIEQILSEIKNKLAELEAALEAESAARAAAEAAAAEAEAKAAAERAAAIAADPIDIDIDLSASEIPDAITPESETVTPSFTETRENALSGATVSDTPQNPATVTDPQTRENALSGATVSDTPQNPATVTDPQTRENALSGATVSDSPQSINDATQAVKSVNDRSATPHAWRTGLPGSPVRNILSAISLNDRVLFINTLFQEDPALFQSTIAQFNNMQSLADAEAYIETHFPGWNLDSDIAYRFMMAVRRKLQ
ncbi:MAG: hypothetical protein IJU74_03880 [Bacteroidales bacterium]|nr:hypothetical protein [Bacteroidales bacterium]